MEDNKSYLLEAFKAFDDLKEDVFDITVADGLEKAKEYDDEIIDDVSTEVIIDPLAADEEEIKDSYVGKAILKCSICQSMIYKDPEEVIIDEEAELANVGESCPYCQSEDGYYIIGEVAEYCPECHEESEEDKEEDKLEDDSDEEEVEVEESEEVEEDDGIDESIKTRRKVRVKKDDNLSEATKRGGKSNVQKVMCVLDSLKESSKRDDIDADSDDKKELAKDDFEKAKDDADSDRDYKLKKNDLKESDKPAAISIEDAQKWVDYDMEKYGKISDRTNRLIKKAGFQILKDDHGDYEVAAGKYDESLKEDFERVDIETDREKMSMTADKDGKVTVTTEPKEEEIKNSEVIEPVSDEVKAQFKVTEEEPEEIEYDFDEFEESDFDELGESYLKRVYENVKSFKTTQGAINGNKLKLEGLITFKSGKQAKTNFVFESYKATKTGKLKFIGENKQFAKGKKSFTLSGRADGKKLVCESLTYSYVGKSSDGTSKKLYGTVRK